MDIIMMIHATFYSRHTKLIYLAVILQILLYCRFVNAAMETRMEQCVLPSEGGVKVWSLCTKQMIDACQPGMYQSDNCSVTQASCKSCSRGSFTPGWNNCSICFQCSTCEFGIEEDCSADRDTRCKLVPNAPEKIQGTSTRPSLRIGSNSSETDFFESQDPMKSISLKNVTTPDGAEFASVKSTANCRLRQEEDTHEAVAHNEEIPLRSDDNTVHDKEDEMQAG
ncbi:tumor necrosis factor receptor superfamily member 22-like isoform X2 [Lytechinus pictus]|uniref:tumor necrosis factor receptor superfamily member 22-like isoform X2 n=1 Tax=Lytechinus pictus TaxID=7653 RepID=UPI0030B9FD34